jgi:hypothetical protein
MISLLCLINRSATELDAKSVEYSLKLLNELSTSIKKIIPKNTFTFVNTDCSGIELIDTINLKENYVFFGWIFIEAFNSEMCLWNIFSRNEVTYSFSIVNRRLVYCIDAPKAKLEAVQSKELSLNQWYFLELYHFKEAQKSLLQNTVTSFLPS